MKQHRTSIYSNDQYQLTLEHQDDGLKLLLVEISAGETQAAIYIDADQLRRMLNAVTPPESTR